MLLRRSTGIDIVVCLLLVCTFCCVFCCLVMTIGSCDSVNCILFVQLFVHMLVYMLSCPSLERYSLKHIWLGAAEVSLSQLFIQVAFLYCCVNSWSFFPVMCIVLYLVHYTRCHLFVIILCRLL